MIVNDPVGDMLTRLRNGQRAQKGVVLVPFSRERLAVLDVLKSEGYIRAFEVQDVRKGIKNILVSLKYFEGRPVITTIKRVSKPGRRVYSGKNDIRAVCSGLGTTVVSTSKGVMPASEARILGLGGELICEVF